MIESTVISHYCDRDESCLLGKITRIIGQSNSRNIQKLRDGLVTSCIEKNPNGVVGGIMSAE